MDNGFESKYPCDRELTVVGDDDSMYFTEVCGRKVWYL